jgi:RND superfamily putative drug exporter
MARNRNKNAPLLDRWARLAYRRRGRVIGAWVFGLIALVVLQVAFAGEFDSGFEMPGTESQDAIDLLETRYPERAGSDADVVFQATAGIETLSVRNRIEAILAEIAGLEAVGSIESPFDQPGYISDDGTIARAVVHFSELATAIPAASIDGLLETVDSSNGDGLRVEAGGDAVWWNEEPDFSSEWVGLIFAALILLIAFGSVVAMGLPLGAAIFSLGTGFALIILGANVLSFPDFAPQFAAMIGIGVGIDYALLVVTRFREGLHSGMNVEDSVARAVSTAGRSVIFAGVAVAVSFLGLWVMGIPAIGALGTAGGIVVLTAVLIAVTLMPALLSLAGHRIDRWKVPFLHSTEGVDRNSGWYRLSKMIQRRPVPVFAVAVVVLIVLAAPILDMRLGFTDAGNNPDSFHSRRAYDLQAEGFGPGFNAPIIVMVDLADVAASERDEVVDAAIEQLRGLDNVVQVNPAQLNPAGDAALITVLPGTKPQDGRTNDVVHAMRGDIAPLVDAAGGEMLVTGGVASNVDSQDRIIERMPYLFIGVIGLSFLLLMVVFRSVLVAAKAAIMNLLSIGAAYGVVVAVFQWGWGADIIGVETGPVETFLPMMMFAIVFGLSMDYEVFLISRIREEHLAGNDNATAVAHGLTATARVITAAAAILIAVFGSFVLGADRIIKEFGLGLATAIFVDATIVRLFLVPATMELLGERNWWLPGWLDRLLPHINVEGTPALPEPAGAPAGGR